ASSFASCPEVSGKSSYATQEEYGGETVTIMADFTSFKSYKDCIVFRSRVLLANDRYAGNALIQEAIANHDSDKMAEGLKDAGYATSSAYVDSLKSIMKTYNLYRFDGMTLDQFKSGTASGNAIVEAAHSQLGVPYVWGGSTPNVGLDCSGLTQWCYAQAGISIPRYSEDQATGGTKIPLSEARPGDILWRPGHVAIYIGGDQYIHEPQTGDVCKISNGISYFTCAVRYL
ncbi:MAG: C40 family peptidase, partial [Eggerthellaceae bacterium]|nr:C40 family peptidase [Eggerthellaceae bacterium]